VSTLAQPLPVDRGRPPQPSGSGELEWVVEMAHDLRSPLSAILALAETLRDGRSGGVNEVQKHQLGLIYSAALYLCAEASDLTELMRGSDRLSDLEPAPFSLADTLGAVRGMVQPMVEEKGLELSVRTPLPDQRLGFPRPLCRVLLNLSTNAIKYTERGRVTIGARALDATRVEFSVRDTGPGLAPDALPGRFQAFPQAPLEMRQHFSSAGLGLSICHKLVAAMGAELRVDTLRRRGTRFHFELPLPPAAG